MVGWAVSLFSCLSIINTTFLLLSMQSLYISTHIPIQITNAQEVSKDIENFLKEANSYFYDGNDSLAITMYDKVLAIDPKNVNATVMKELLYHI